MGLVRLLEYQGKRFWVAQGIDIKVNVQLGPVKMLIMQQIYVKNLADRGIAKPREIPRRERKYSLSFNAPTGCGGYPCVGGSRGDADSQRPSAERKSFVVREDGKI